MKPLIDYYELRDKFFKKKYVNKNSMQKLINVIKFVKFNLINELSNINPEISFQKYFFMNMFSKITDYEMLVIRKIIKNDSDHTDVNNCLNDDSYDKHLNNPNHEPKELIFEQKIYKNCVYYINELGVIYNNLIECVGLIDDDNKFHLFDEQILLDKNNFMYEL